MKTTKEQVTFELNTPCTECGYMFKTIYRYNWSPNDIPVEGDEIACNLPNEEGCGAVYLVVPDGLKLIKHGRRDKIKDQAPSS